ncbi:hypothetical protein APHAL10511_005478 [Amanita phalloides]|nr:hypothetical protein APHAL10511_005478 [Amanita phalloides]
MNHGLFSTTPLYHLFATRSIFRHIWLRPLPEIQQQYYVDSVVVMPLRSIRIPRPQFDKSDVIGAVVATSALAKELSNLSMFPPIVATASVLLLILQTVQSIEKNKDACSNLVHRCAQVLLDLNDIMKEKWDTASPSLLRNLAKYTETVEEIYKFMKAQASEKWAKRLFKKASIEVALADFDKKLSDATQMFQIALLIDIGHNVLSGKKQAPNTDLGQGYFLDKDAYLEQPPTYKSRQNTLDEWAVPPGVPIVVSGDTTTATEDTSDHSDADEVLVSTAVLEDRGFRKYHTSEVRPTGRSKIKSGWWADTASADINGQFTLVKYYEGSSKNQAIKRWLHDIKVLQNIFHPNLPHMTGYSNEHSPNPFILLSDVRTNAPDKIINYALKHEGVAESLNLLARYYSDIADASAYLQRQLNLSDRQLQDFVEKTDFRVGASNTIIMGLPPARDGTWLSWRNYDLSHSLAQVILHMLPGRGTVQRRLEHYQDTTTEEDPLKVAHLVLLARGLLSTKSSASPLVTKLLTDDDEFDGLNHKPKISMKELRRLSLQAGIHDFSWTEMSAIPPHKFAVGDFGFVPKDTPFSKFVKLGNIYSDKLANIPITAREYGTQFCWEDRPVQHVEMQRFCFPGDVFCWPISVPRGAQIDCQVEHSEHMSDVTQAWNFLIQHANQLAARFNVPEEDLILVSTAGTNQSFYIRDFGNHISNDPIHRMSQMHAPFHHPHTFMNISHTTMSVPTIMYLITSPRPDLQPFWSHQPMYNPNAPQLRLNHGWVSNVGFCHGFVQWIKLLKEDFAD